MFDFFLQGKEIQIFGGLVADMIERHSMDMKMTVSIGIAQQKKYVTNSLKVSIKN